MKIRLFALLVPAFCLAACGGSSNNTNNDGNVDTKVDKADTKVDTAETADVPTSTDTADAPASEVADAADASDAADAPASEVADAADAMDASDAADKPASDAADAPASDAADGGAGDASDASDAGDGPVPTTQKLTLTELVVDQSGDAGAPDGATDAFVTEAGLTVDPALVNPWGLAINPAGPIWVANNGTGTSTAYNAMGSALPVFVSIPVPVDGGTPPSAPTGLVFNGTTTNFMGDKFIFVTEDGTVAGWQTGNTAVTRADNSGTGTIYKGATIATSNAATHLYATDFHNNKVDVWDSNYAKITTAGQFTDPNMPAGFAPFGIQAIGSSVYVTYAKQDAMAKDDLKGVGNGYVDVYNFDGTLSKRLISAGMLNSPWGVALAPGNFAGFSNALLVGNFGDGHINAYNATTGAFVGTALNGAGTVPLEIDGLWGLAFGPGTTGAATNQLFFTAGPDDEKHGLLGRLDAVP